MIYGCDGLQAFRTFTDANRAGTRIRKFDKNKGGMIAVFRCAYCPCWHIGSKPKGKKSK